MRARRATPRRREAPREDFDWWLWVATPALVDRSHARCEVGGCDLNSTGMERHHRQRRRDGGDRLANVLAVCPRHHQWVTEHPEQARENGWIVSAYEPDPGTVPVRIGGYWWTLRDDGGKTPLP